VQVGDLIDVTSGINSNGTKNVFSLMECLFANGFRELVVPVVDAGEDCTAPQMFGVRRVVGFETIVLDGASSTNRSVNFHAVLRAGLPAQPGATSCP
jgi:hypothetical protein